MTFEQVVAKKRFWCKIKLKLVQVSVVVLFL